MREKLIVGLVAIFIALFGWDLYKIFMVLPDEAAQGAIFRIIYIHLPQPWSDSPAFRHLRLVFASGIYLAKGDLKVRR